MNVIIIEDPAKIGRLITTIGKSGQKMDALIHQAACSSLVHASKHGDVTLMSRLVNSMPRSARREALIYWTSQHSPLVWTKGAEGNPSAFRLNKGKKAREFNISGACNTPFWDFSPEKNPAPFTIDRLVKLVQSKVKKAVERGELAREEVDTVRAKLAAIEV